MPTLTPVQRKALARLSREWVTASALNIRIQTMWVLMEKGLVEAKPLAYTIKWRLRCDK